MHDIDRTQMEYSPEMEAYDMEEEFEQEEEQEQFEYGETEWGAETGVFSEADEMQLAAELLEVTSEDELDRFLGGLIKKAGGAIGQFVKSPVGQQLGGLLKGAAKKALPMVGSAVGGYFGGSSGARIGGQAASTAGRIFGLELEGLSQEDQEFEAAKGFVRFAGEAVKNAASSRPMPNPRAAAQAATMAAARQLAPGLIGKSPAYASSSSPVGGRANSGRWIRRGNKIVLYGA